MLNKKIGGVMPLDTELLKFKGYYVELNKKIENDKALEFALKKLKRIIKDSDLLLEIQRTQYFTKPSALRRDKLSKARARQRHETRRQCQ